MAYVQGVGCFGWLMPKGYSSCLTAVFELPGHQGQKASDGRLFLNHQQQEEENPMNPAFATLVEDIECNAAVLQDLAAIIQAIHHENRYASAQELAICRRLRKGLDKNFKQIIALLYQMEHALIPLDQDNQKPGPE